MESKSLKSFHKTLHLIWSQRALHLMLLPGLVCLLLFCYLPMYGIVIAFQDYQLGDAIGISRWVGFQHFIDFFHTRDVWQILRNTIAMSMLGLLIGFPVPILFALLLNECQNQGYKRVVQTISYLPHFISWVVVTAIVMQFLSNDGGAVNELLLSLHIIDEPIMFMGEPRYFWMIVVLSDVWKNVGWNTIIYLSAISSINIELYDAASIDGANRVQKARHVTIPGIGPTVTILLILQISKLLNTSFEEIMLFTNDMKNSMVKDVAEVIDTYVLRYGIRQMRFSYASAVGLFRSVVSVLLLVTSNFISRKVTDSSLF